MTRTEKAVLVLLLADTAYSIYVLVMYEKRRRFFERLNAEYAAYEASRSEGK